MIVDVKSYVEEKKEELKKCLAEMSLSLPGGAHPSLLILQNGNNPASNKYINGKIKDGEELGISVDLVKVNRGEDIKGAFGAMKDILTKRRYGYTGIILQEPSGFDEQQKETLLNLIEERQDVDGFKPNSYFHPCTPAGIMGIIDHFYAENLDGVTVVVVGRGELVGKPLIPLLIEKGATVVNCNSKTYPLADYTKMGDIVVTAVGKPNLITRDMLKTGAFVIDAGIAFDENGKLCGDCSKDFYEDEDILVTPVPGGVGLTTRLQLMENVYESFSL